MMTIQEYRTADVVNYPTNGSGLQMPQLIDDIWETRAALLRARSVLERRGRTLSDEDCHVAIAIGRLNRVLNQLEIKI